MWFCYILSTKAAMISDNRGASSTYRLTMLMFTLGDIQKLRWQVFALFWLPIYLWLTFVDIWGATYLMSTLTFSKKIPHPLQSNMYLILLCTLCRVPMCTHPEIKFENEWSVTSGKVAHTLKVGTLFWQDSCCLPAKWLNFQTFYIFTNVNVDFESSSTYLPTIDICWHFMKYLPTSSCQRSFWMPP